MALVVCLLAAAVCLACGLIRGAVQLSWAALVLGVLTLVIISIGLVHARRTRTTKHTAGALTGSTGDVPNPESISSDDIENLEGELAESGNRQNANGRDGQDQIQGRSGTTGTPSQHNGKICRVEAAPVPLKTTESSQWLVRVVPGRRRFHLADCALVADRDSEEITVNEALEEGLSACSSCIPDRSALTERLDSAAQ